MKFTKVIWRIGCCPSSKSPLSMLLKWSNGKARANTTGSSNIAGVGRTTQTVFGTPAPDFASRLTPEAFSMSGYSHKAVEVWNWSFPSLCVCVWHLTHSPQISITYSSVEPIIPWPIYFPLMLALTDKIISPLFNEADQEEATVNCFDNRYYNNYYYEIER